MRLALTLLALGALLLAPTGALGQDKVLEYDGIPGNRDCHTENCSPWHELYPNFCASWHQESWEDNGDGCLSACDYISFEDGRYHVDWVGPTYWLDCEKILEPIDPQPGDPTCQEWIEVWPDYGNVWHIVEWIDNGDGEVGFCDVIFISIPGGPTYECHINQVALNIHVTGDGTANDDSSWSKVKQFFTPPF